MGRTEKAAKNGIVGIISYGSQALLSIYCQHVFIKTLGYNISGLNNILYTIISSLSLVELGIGSAITFSLYEPLAHKDYPKVAALVRLYKKIYYTIGCVILFVGILLIPFLPEITQFRISECIVPYLLVLGNAVVSYFMTYNQTILNADQKNYIVTAAMAVTRITYCVVQVAILYLTQNYTLYIGVNVLCLLMANVYLSVYVKREYPYLSDKSGEIDYNTKHKIKENVFALIFHKIGNYLISGADNIIISMVSGIGFVAYYSNYTLISINLKALLESAFSGLVSGFGNLIATEDLGHIKQVFARARMLNHSVYMIVTVGYFVCIETFLEYCYTPETILPMSFLIVFCLNFYLTGYAAVAGNMRSAAGIFKPDQYINIIVPALNVVLSVFFVKCFGVMGVILGTLICTIVKEIVVVPYICSKYVFKESVWNYQKQLCYDLMVGIFDCLICYVVAQSFDMQNLIIRFLCRGFSVVVISALILKIFYGSRPEFIYCLEILSKIKSKVIAKGLRITKE